MAGPTLLDLAAQPGRAKPLMLRARHLRRLVADLLRHGQSRRGVAAPGFEVPTVQRHVGRAPQGPGPEGRGALVVGQRPGEPPAAGGEVGTELEEQGEGGDQAEEGLVGGGGVAPVGSREEVVPLPLEPSSQATPSALTSSGSACSARARK